MNAPATVARAGIPRMQPQHMRALERANKVRLARARLKRAIALGDIDVADVLIRCPWEADSMAVADLLMSQRRWGQTRCRKCLAQVPVSEKKAIGSMTERQRQTLARLLRSVSACGEPDTEQDGLAVQDGIAAQDGSATQDGLSAHDGLAAHATDDWPHTADWRETGDGPRRSATPG
jgi:hypothetical protein